jgi:hypothetical protein
MLTAKSKFLLRIHQPNLTLRYAGQKREAKGTLNEKGRNVVLNREGATFDPGKSLVMHD